MMAANYDEDPGGLLDEMYEIVRPLDVLVQWEAFAGLPNRADLDTTKEALVDTYWQTICAGALLPEGKAETKAAFWEWYRTMNSFRSRKREWFAEYKRFAALITILRHLRKLWSDFARFEQLSGITYNRRLAKTKTGRLALVPRTTRIGDGIMLCRVSDSPLIIRETTRNGINRFVGLAYVHGVVFDHHFCHPMHFE